MAGQNPPTTANFCNVLEDLKFINRVQLIICTSNYITFAKFKKNIGKTAILFLYGMD